MSTTAKTAKTKTTKKVAVVKSPSPTPTTDVSKIIFVHESLMTEKDVYEIALGVVEVKKEKILSKTVKSYVIEDFSKNVNQHKENRKLIKTTVCQGKVVILKKLPDTQTLIHPQSVTMLKEVIKSQRRAMKKHNDQIGLKYQTILEEYQNNYVIKKCCHHHENNVFECSYTLVQMAVDFFLHTTAMP